MNYSYYLVELNEIDTESRVSPAFTFQRSPHLFLPSGARSGKQNETL